MPKTLAELDAPVRAVAMDTEGIVYALLGWFGCSLTLYPF
jgi:hypothetical protein